MIGMLLACSWDPFLYDTLMIPQWRLEMPNWECSWALPDTDHAATELLQQVFDIVPAIPCYSSVNLPSASAVRLDAPSGYLT